MKDQPVFEKRMDDFLTQRREEAFRFSDHLGRNPETSGKEFESSHLFVEVLRKNGFSVEFPFLGLPTAFMAKKISKGKPGGKVALLTEYDALPEIGHACGHNAHGTMSLYAGLALGEVVEETGGEVWVVGTPAEEEDGAKSAMSDQGIFDSVDLALMFHAFGRDSFTDYRSLALDGYDFTFKGKPAHAAATPWEGISALHGVQLFLMAQDMLRLHLRPEARLHAIITEGGAATNIIPESASCRVEFRAPKRPYLDQVAEAVFNCARGAALATGTEVSWQKFMLSFDDMLPSLTAEAVMKDILADLGVTCSSGQGPTGSTDVGNVSYRCPAIQPELAITPLPLSLHTHEFAEATMSPTGHEAIFLGSRALARMGLRVLMDAKLREAMHQDFLSARKEG